MGREVRKVPPKWEHPKMEGWRGERGDLQPMFDRPYEDARREWLEGLAAHKPEECNGCDYWEWCGNPPERSYYRPWRDEEATWLQVWETVSEGTPVSPPFATREELAQYLAEHGDFWDQQRGRGGWGIERAKAFVNVGWVPSAAVLNGELLESKDVAAALEARRKTR